jgi:hypothetical protein
LQYPQDPQQDNDPETNPILANPKLIRTNLGLVNPQTMQIPTDMGIWWASWKWAVENETQAKVIMQSVYKVHGEILSDEEWNEMIGKKKFYMYTERRAKK